METMPLPETMSFYLTTGFPEVKEKAKLMYLNYPNNPTGTASRICFFRRDRYGLRKSNGLCVVHDFAYGGDRLRRKRPSAFAKQRERKTTGIEIYTLSKTYNMAGWRVGFAVRQSLCDRSGQPLPGPSVCLAV